MAKQIIRLTEGDLHRIIENSVKKIIRESDWQKAFNDFLDMPDITDSAEGAKLQKAKDDAIKAEFGNDEKARAKAVKRYFKNRERDKMSKMSAKQREEYLKYDDPNEDDDDAELNAFAAEKAKSRYRGLKPSARVGSSAFKKAVEAQNNPFAGRTPEELEALLKKHWGQ